MFNNYKGSLPQMLTRDVKIPKLSKQYPQALTRAFKDF